MRRVCRDEKLLEKLETGELTIVVSDINERRNPSPSGPSLADAPYNREFIAADWNGNEVLRCHQFLKADRKTPAASGLPDPKEINWKGYNYHQTGNQHPDCEHCKAGISTFSDAVER